MQKSNFTEHNGKMRSSLQQQETAAEEPAQYRHSSTLPWLPCVYCVHFWKQDYFFSMKHAFCIPNFCLRILDLKKSWNPVDFL